MFEQLFTNRSENDNILEERMKRLEMSVEACLGGSYNGSVISASAKVCMDWKEENKDSNEFDSKWGQEIGLDSSRIATIGSPLSEKEEWGTNHNFFEDVIIK